MLGRTWRKWAPCSDCVSSAGPGPLLPLTTQLWVQDPCSGVPLPLMSVALTPSSGPPTGPLFPLGFS